MSNKRKREDDADVSHAASNSALSKPTQEIVKYFEELRQHFDTLNDSEEQALLVANALDEAKAQEVAVAADPGCSRVLEVLLPAAEPQQVANFFQAVMKSDTGLLSLASSPFGAHVLEVLLDQLTKAMESAALQEAEELLSEAQSSLCAQLFDFLINRYATHVARRLLCIMAGRNVLPLAAKSQNKKAKGGALAAKVTVLPGKLASLPTVAYPDALHAVVDTLLSADYVGALNGLMYDQNASPFLQGVLKACEGNDAALEQLIPALLGAQASEEDGDCSLLQGINRAGFQGIMQDRLSSHVMEVVFSVAPQPLLEEFHSSFLSGDLPALAFHASANFALQAFLAAANRTPVVKSLLGELKGSFSDLLQRRRSGVVAAMLAACARTSTGQADASKALVAAVTSIQDQGKGLAETLLTLDVPGRICGPDMKPGQRVRLAPLGCAMLSTLLTFPQEFSQAFVSSIGDWSPSETLRVGQDSGGSRVLEALVNAPATSKAKKKLLRKLKGLWAVLAVEPGGNHVVESCYMWGGVKDKEVIAGELANAEATLGATPRGAALMRKCNTSAFRSSSTDWKKKAASDAQTLNEYAQLFGEADTTAAVDTAEPDNNEQRNTAANEPVPASPAAAKPTDQATAGGKPKKKRKSDQQLGKPVKQDPPAAELQSNDVTTQSVGSDPKTADVAAAEQVPVKKTPKGKKGSDIATDKRLGSREALTLLGFGGAQHEQPAHHGKKKKKKPAKEQ